MPGKIYLKRISRWFLQYFVVPVVSLWMILAVWYSNLPGKILPVIAVIALISILLAISIKIKDRRHAYGFLFCLFITVLIWHLLVSPSNERDWLPQFRQLTTADVSKSGDEVIVHNIRNSVYRTKDDFDIRYYDKTFSIEQIRGVDLLISYWGNKSIAHTFLSFEFADDQHLAISIEIRPESDESYNPLAGLFKQYELFYAVGDERDIIRLRTNYRMEDTYLYQSSASPEQAWALFTDMMNRINHLADKPDFYGTIRQNCTTALVRHVNKILSEEIPFSGRLLFNGFSDKLAYSKGLIRATRPFPELKAACYISGIARELDQDPQFSSKIRTHIQQALK